MLFVDGENFCVRTNWQRKKEFIYSKVSITKKMYSPGFQAYQAISLLLHHSQFLCSPTAFVPTTTLA